MAPKRPKSGRSSAGSKGKGKGKKTQPPTPQDKPGHPDDIFPLVLTSATQELFGCRTDEDVTRENPYKLLQKDSIMQDIKKRAAVSDFSPVKQIVLEYPEEEMLLVFDRSFTYGQCFYLVLTPEAKDRILNPPEPETPEVFESEVSKTPQPKLWVSLGSEQEIDEESVTETREKLCYKFSRVRRKFGVPVCFSDRGAAAANNNYLECSSYQDSRFSIKQLQRDCGMQAVPRLQTSGAQTLWRFQKNICTQFYPRELHEEGTESIIQAENQRNLFNSVTPRVLQALQQEEIVNVFLDDCKALGNLAEAGDWSGKVSEDLVLHYAFTDQEHTKDKQVSSIHWHPTIFGVIAVALTDKNKVQMDESSASKARPAIIVFYSFSDPSNPQLLLECPGDVSAFEFSPSNPNIIVGGCVTGQVVLWDISAHVTRLQRSQPGDKEANADVFDGDDNKENKALVARYCAASPLHSGRKAPITDVQWLPQTFEVTKRGLPMENTCKVSVQVVTCSPYSSVMFWDVRVPQNQQKMPMTPHIVPATFRHLDRTWKPLLRISLPKLDNGGEYAPYKFSLEPYTCNGNTGRNSEEAADDDGTEELPDYSQLRAPSAQTLTALEDINTKFYFGTQDGEVVYMDWKLEKDDSGQLHSSKPLLSFRTHQGLVNSVQRSPFFKDVLLTTGSYNFAIWKEDFMDGPIVVSPSSELQCIVGCWSPSRPAVFFIGKQDGSVEVWDLLESCSEPSHLHPHISSSSITCIKPWTVSSKLHFLAVTDDLGTLRVFVIPKTLYLPSRTESLSVMKYFELGKVRLKNYLKLNEARVKDKREKKTDPEKPVKVLHEDSENMKKFSLFPELEEKLLKDSGL